MRVCERKRNSYNDEMSMVVYRANIGRAKSVNTEVRVIDRQTYTENEGGKEKKSLKIQRYQDEHIFNLLIFIVVLLWCHISKFYRQWKLSVYRPETFYITTKVVCEGLHTALPFH